jgi:hypothetical protein
VQYSFDNGFYVAARYRYDYTRYPANAGKDDDKVNRGDAWAGYVFGDWRTELNYVYARSTEGVKRNDNKPYSQEYNSRLPTSWIKTGRRTASSATLASTIAATARPVSA